MKAAMLLIDAKRVVEGRTITRCILKNVYWIVGLAEEGEQFVRKMRDDEIHHRRARGQNIFSAGVELEQAVSDGLRKALAYLGSKVQRAKSLSPKDAAAIQVDFEKTYIFYSQLSSDAAHPSVTALNRYIIPNSDPDSGGIDVEPLASDTEFIARNRS